MRLCYILLEDLCVFDTASILHCTCLILNVLVAVPTRRCASIITAYLLICTIRDSCSAGKIVTIVTIATIVTFLIFRVYIYAKTKILCFVLQKNLGGPKCCYCYYCYYFTIVAIVAIVAILTYKFLLLLTLLLYKYIIINKIYIYIYIYLYIFYISNNNKRHALALLYVFWYCSYSCKYNAYAMSSIRL